MSILTGTYGLVDNWLELEPIGKPPYYQHRTVALALSKRNRPLQGTADFLEAAYERIDQNSWDAITAGYSRPSRENWRWKRHTDLNPENVSPEVTLERAIVKAMGDDWSNQVPTSSGLVGPAIDKRRCIDLVYREDATSFEFIELKVASDTALFAAIEILLYGLLFVWSRDHKKALRYDVGQQPILSANRVSLCVLAPAQYYLGEDLSVLARTLNEALPEFGEGHGIALSFEFAKFGEDIDASSRSEDLVTAIKYRASAWKSL